MEKKIKLTAFISWIFLFVCLFLLTGCTLVLRKSWSMCCDRKTVNLLYEGDILLYRHSPQANHQCTNKQTQGAGYVPQQNVWSQANMYVLCLKTNIKHFLKNRFCYPYVTRILFVRKSAATRQLPAEDFYLGSAEKQVNSLVTLL